MNLMLEFEKIKAKYWDPKNPTSRLVFKDPRQCIRFDFGIVDDNQDPDKKGRLKIRFPHWGAVTTNWISLVRPYESSSAGIWMQPDVGTQVICAFFNDDPSRPIVLGSVFTPRAKPPLETNEDNNFKVLTTKSGSKIIFDDKDGEEKILIHTKDAKMRLVLDKAKGISLVNEDGDIAIKCKKLIVEGEDDTFIKMQKGLTIKCRNDKLSMKAKGTFAIKSGKDVVLKANTKIKLKGKPGVTAGMKQIAKKDDIVVGVDLHDIQVPTSGGLVTVPAIPHPYVGKLANQLSQNVDVNDKAAAYKGSKSKYDTPGHICMPPGVKFASQPNNEGEVSSNTAPTVKINGKEAATLGSMVKTCNDPQPQETCSIIAVGVPVILPIMMPGMDPDQFKKDGGTRFNSQNPVTTKAATPNQDKQPKLQNPKWSVDRATVGEEVTLSVSCSDQYENANVYFLVWPDGADTTKDAPVAKLSGQNKGGTAEAKWRYTMKGFEFETPEENPSINFIEKRLGVPINQELVKYYIENYKTKFKNPFKKTAKFFFTVKSFRCEEKKSGSIEIGDDLVIVFYDNNGKLLKNVKYSIHKPDGSFEDGTTGNDGKIEKKAWIPGKYQIRFIHQEGK
jgi:uncharacterized Zn-binding protein involved in type VI secretion